MGWLGGLGPGGGSKPPVTVLVGLTVCHRGTLSDAARAHCPSTGSAWRGRAGAIAVSARRRSAKSAAHRRAPRTVRNGCGPDAQNDGGRGALWHWQAGATERVFFRRQNGHGPED